MKFNLQFFAGEKTEKATPKKREDLKKKGQVVQTKDINSALSLMLVFVVLSWLSHFFMNTLTRLYYNTMEWIGDTKTDFSVPDFMSISIVSLIATAKIVLPVLFVVMLTGVICSYAQVGVIFSVEPLQFKFEKISMFKGLQRMFSMKSVVELIKAIIKTMIVLYVAYSYIKDKSYILLELWYMDFNPAIVVVWDIVYNIVIRTSGILLVIGVLDYAYKKWSNEKEIMMSKQEIKEEYKQMEGDPHIKGKIKEKQRQMAMSRMMQDVPGADVIITNPTHYAIALKYIREKKSAPIVVAKGKDLVAQNIKSIAKENDVPIVENKPLARALYDAVDIGEMIPPDMFEAVADILAYVYKLKNRRA